MPRVNSNGIELEYERFGDGPPIVLIMGIGAQMLLWDEGLCRMLADRGHSVIRFDNRDVGGSTWLDGVRAPGTWSALLKGALKRPLNAPYTLSDMAADTVGLLDALELERAHVVGASMGGMIAQTLAIEHPDRLLSLTSIMSTTGATLETIPTPGALKALLMPPPRSREEAMDQSDTFIGAVGGSLPHDRERSRELWGQSYDRGSNPAGFLRQWAAIMASGDRTRALRSVRVPTLVLHGARDPLVPVRGGLGTVRAVPNARLQMIDGMGHSMPSVVWPTIVDAITRHAREHAG